MDFNPIPLAVLITKSLARPFFNESARFCVEHTKSTVMTLSLISCLTLLYALAKTKALSQHRERGDIGFGHKEISYSKFLNHLALYKPTLERQTQLP